MPSEKPQEKSEPEIDIPVAVFEHLTGPSRGTVTWAGERNLDVTLDRDQFIHISVGRPDGLEGSSVGSLRRSNGTYEITAVEGQPIWVNGRLIQSRQLEDRDMIEFGESGPMSRIYLCRDGQPLHFGVADVLSDAAAYARSSRRPLAGRLAAAAAQVPRRLSRESTILFRIGIVIALVMLAVGVYQQSRINTLLRQQIESSTAQLESFSRLLARAGEEALTSADLETFHEELAAQIARASERLSELERRSTAIAGVIAESRSSILFLQGAYGFVEPDTGRMLRHVIGEDGKPVTLPGDTPLLSIDADGPVAERQFIGTGFAVGDNGIFVTSRHVAEPWEHDVNVEALAAQGLEPVMIRFIGYLPGFIEAAQIAIIRTSGEADVAVLRLEEVELSVSGLPLAEAPPAPGDEIVVMGYPTGMRIMLAQAGRGFVEELKGQKEIDFWTLAARLAESDRITPLATRGIVGRISEEAIVYDAETTYGGSGGPVLNVNGAVVAINTAILPEYGGSNLGVPVDKLRRLLNEVEQY